jgi:hypothetical protein
VPKSRPQHEPFPTSRDKICNRGQISLPGQAVGDDECSKVGPAWRRWQGCWAACSYLASAPTLSPPHHNWVQGRALNSRRSRRSITRGARTATRTACWASATPSVTAEWDACGTRLMARRAGAAARSRQPPCLQNASEGVADDIQQSRKHLMLMSKQRWRFPILAKAGAAGRTNQQVGGK